MTIGSYQMEVFMQLIISKSKFKPHSLEYFRKVEKTGQEIIITDHGRPVLKIVPFSTDPEEAMKILKGSVLQYIDPTEPIGQEDWECLT